MNKIAYVSLFFVLILSKVTYSTSAHKEFIKNYLQTEYDLKRMPEGLIALKRELVPYLQAYKKEIKKNFFNFTIGRHRFHFKKIPKDESLRPLVSHKRIILPKKKKKKIQKKSKNPSYSLSDIYKTLNNGESYFSEESLYSLITAPKFFPSNCVLSLEKFQRKLAQEFCLDNLLQQFRGRNWFESSEGKLALLIPNPKTSNGSLTRQAHKQLTFTKEGKVLLQTFFGAVTRVERFKVELI